MITLFIMKAVKSWRQMLFESLLCLIMLPVLLEVAGCVQNANRGDLSPLILTCIVFGVIDLVMKAYFQTNPPDPEKYITSYMHFNLLFWDNEFHHAVMYQKWNKIDTYASKFKKITDEFTCFFILTDSFNDLSVEDLEKAFNIFAEVNPKFFSQNLINTVCSDVKRGLHNGYFIVEERGHVDIKLAGDHGFISI